MPGSVDHRGYARIESTISCNVATATDAFEAVVANLSRSGAAILGPDGVAKADERVTLMLSASDGWIDLAVPGSVVRIQHHEGRSLYGVRFEPLPPDDDAQLERLLHMVTEGPGPGRRQQARVAARVEVNCRSDEIFRAWLNDLSRGGLSVKTLRDVPMGAPMSVAFGVPGLKSLIEVQGTVVGSQKLEHGFRIGMRFVPMTDVERAQVTKLLDVLLGLKLPEPEILVED